MTQVRPLDAAKYQSHPLHALERNWPETNCYVDLWVELLHGLGHEPTAALPFVFATDFEGDHFTFFKQPQEDLFQLYGLTVQEQPIWRRVVDHLAEQLALGRPVLVELDSYYLPDTQGTAYRQAHVKTTVAANALDLEGKRLGYFHNRGYYALAGEDFDGVLRLVPGLSDNPNILPPYAEVVKMEPARALQGRALLDRSLQLLKLHLARRPSKNPVASYRTRVEADVAWLLTEPMESYHVYVFNTLRQLGASYELGQSYLQWLGAQGVGGLDEAGAACRVISDGCKSLLLVLARAATRKKKPDLKASLDALEAAWERIFSELPSRLG
ncbi:MAG: DUF1839 family protein [Archangiaceae bacterium]|nr:DUF1839 family protein [Archangiaceae bacterium]